MLWTERPSGAQPTWAADELRMRMMGQPIELRLETGETTSGTLDHVNGSDVLLDLGHETVSVGSARIVAFRILERPADGSAEVRG